MSYLFFKSLCAQDFFWTTLHEVSSVFGTTCTKYVQTHFEKENLKCAPGFLVCDRLTTQLRGNIDRRNPLYHDVLLVAKR